MDLIGWWRLWVMSGLLTLFVAFLCCLLIIRLTRQEVREALGQVKCDYEANLARLERLSDRMDTLEEQLLNLLLYLHPAAAD